MRKRDESFRQYLRRDRKAAVAVLVATAMPVIAGAGALGMEVTQWWTNKIELQRIADAAALAGIIKYANTDSAQSGATSALKMAELGGLTGGGTPSWNSATSTYANTRISATLTTGVKDSTNNKAIYVSVTKPMPRGISSLIGATSTVNISASSKAELDGAQPCMVTLQNTALSFTNYATVNSNTCAIWSNGSVTAANNVAVSVRDIYATSTISTTNSATITGSKHPNSSSVVDPYASYPDILALWTRFAAGSGSNYTTTSTVTLSPGHYGNITLSNSANVTLSAGTYYIHGTLNLRNSSILTGTGVTLVMSGDVVLEQSSTVNLTAATGDVGGATGGMLMVSSGSNISLQNSGTRNLTGVIYAPNATLSISNAATLTSTACLQYIVGRAAVDNHAYMSASNCVAMGALSFGRRRLLVQ